ncbi:MAG: 23S rRNA (pseudouridine(1915)-N(3))-methyltransferase RlmH, partial [Woeseiaceae bacterium]
IAVGDRQPSWVDEAFDDYVQRLPRHWQFRLETVKTARRRKNADPATAIEAEGQKVLDRVRAAEQLILLDECGVQVSSAGLTEKLSAWQALGRDLCFVIGGPDGVSKAIAARADFRWSLSRLTLPHGLARVLFAEQLYRAWTLATAHPYHRA